MNCIYLPGDLACVLETAFIWVVKAHSGYCCHQDSHFNLDPIASLPPFKHFNYKKPTCQTNTKTVYLRYLAYARSTFWLMPIVTFPLCSQNHCGGQNAQQEKSLFSHRPRWLEARWQKLGHSGRRRHGKARCFYSESTRGKLESHCTSLN